MSESLPFIDFSQIRSCPQLYLFSYLKTDGASMYANFIQAVYENLCFDLPQRVVLRTYDEYQFVSAEGSRLHVKGLRSVPADFAGYDNIINWLMARSSQTRDTDRALLSFEAIALVVYLAAFCTVDLTIEDEHFRQLFYQGQAVTPCERRPVTKFPPYAPYVSLQFTIAPPVFKSRIVNKEQVEEVIKQLHSHHLIPQNLKVEREKVMYQGFEITLQQRGEYNIRAKKEAGT